MQNNREQEINQPDIPEIEQESIPEFEQSTNHPQEDDTQIQSADLRYANADQIYGS